MAVAVDCKGVPNCQEGALLGLVKLHEVGLPKMQSLKNSHVECLEVVGAVHFWLNTDGFYL